MRLAVLTLILGTALKLSAATPIAGYWLGEVEMEHQHYQIGFEFSEQADGAITGRQWFAVLHLFGSDIGTVVGAGEHYRNANLGLDLVLREGELAGTLGEAGIVRLRPSEALLTTPAAPAYPAGPAPVWVYPAGAALWATPATDDEFAFVGDERGVLHAVRLADGRPAWTFNSGAAIHGAALVADGSVFFLSDSGTLFRLDRSTGRIQWSVAIGGDGVVRHPPSATEFSYDFTGPTPALADGVVYVPSASGDVVALNAVDGRLRWRTVVGGMIRNSVLVAGDRLVVGSWNGRATALNRADGAIRWTHETGQPITSDPVIDGDAVLIGSRNSKLYALALVDGSERWQRYHAGSWIESAPRFVDGTLFLGSSDLRTVAALDPATGKPRWSTDVLGWTWGTPAVSNDTVFAGAAGARGYPIAETGGLVALDRHTGAPRWRVELPALADRYVTGIAGSPTLAGKLVLFASQGGLLYAMPAGARP